MAKKVLVVNVGKILASTVSRLLTTNAGMIPIGVWLGGQHPGTHLRDRFRSIGGDFIHLAEADDALENAFVLVEHRFRNAVDAVICDLPDEPVEVLKTLESVQVLTKHGMDRHVVFIGVDAEGVENASRNFPIGLPFCHVHSVTFERGSHEEDIAVAAIACLAADTSQKIRVPPRPSLQP